jgi:2-phospho-L-lactate guanylyltransferase
LQTAAVIPVKKFSRAKTRLGLSQEKTELLCKIMLDEVLAAISQSQKISKIILVSNDESAFEIGKKYNAATIFEERENGVNAAVSLSERYLNENGFDTSVVFPQDIPLIRSEDVDSLLAFQKNTKSLLVVPSRKFDGTNALVRTLTTGKLRGLSTSFVLIQRIMWDVDDLSDIGYIMSNVEKPSMIDKLRKILE